MRSWKTTLSGIVTAVAGFVMFSPDLFAQWPWVVEIAKYVIAGGLVALGIFGKDSNVTGANSPPSKDSASK